MAVQRRTLALYVLLLGYISNQWSRYSIVYLGSVGIDECSSLCSGSSDPDAATATSTLEVPLCASYVCETDSCLRCQTCLDAHDAGFRDVKYATCLSSTQLGVLLSYGYIVLFAIMGLVAGRLADLFNRRNLVAVALVGWSLATVVQGAASSFGVLLLSRMGMGFFHSLSGPASLSMIGDLFPPHERARANGIYTFGIYLGGGLSSISLLMAQSMGWRAASMVIALVGGLGAALLLLLVAEPSPTASKSAVQQGQHSDDDDDDNDNDNGDDGNDGAQLVQQGDEGEEAEEELQQASGYQTLPEPEPLPTAGHGKGGFTLRETLRIISSDRVVLLLFLATPLRFLGGFAIGTFLPQYFKRRFPAQQAVYATLNALVVSLGGATSAYTGGYVSDRWKKSGDVRAPALVPALASLAGLLPFVGVMYSPSFPVAMLCLLLEYLIAESWFGPAISIMQDRLPPQTRGTAVSIYLFIASIVGSVAPLLLGSLDDGATYQGLQRHLMIFVSISYISTAVVFAAVAWLLRHEKDKSEYRPLLQE